jgi:hypothetical protein|tara:strand:- start:1063 stop:1707 length:645 start_codon:yes stop_codon:yes gene_type:complete
MAISTTVVEASLTTKLNATTGSTDGKEFLLLGKAVEALTPSVTVASVIAEGTTQVGLVTAQGNTQVGLVTAEGTTQVSAVQAAGSSYAALAGATFTGEVLAASYNETFAAVTSSSNATTVDCHAGNSFSHTLTENTTFTFTNPPASGTSYTMSIEIIQDSGASGFTVTWPSSVDWPAATAPTLTATASAKDIFVFTTRDGGTNWYGFTAGQALA